MGNLHFVYGKNPKVIAKLAHLYCDKMIIIPLTTTVREDVVEHTLLPKNYREKGI